MENQNNNDDTDENTTIQDLFLYYIDLAIEHGNSSYIDFAIKTYTNIHPSYITWANQIKETLIIESLEEMSI